MGSPEEKTPQSPDSSQSHSNASATTVNVNLADEKSLDLVRPQQQEQRKLQHPLAAVPKRKPVGGGGANSAPDVVTFTVVPDCDHALSDAEAGIAHPGAGATASYSNKKSPWALWTWPFGGFNFGLGSGLGNNWRSVKHKLEQKLPFAHDRRKCRLFLIGTGAGIAILLLALIIGLAVGLTVGKKYATTPVPSTSSDNDEGSASNLPLPTSHGGPYVGDLTYYNPGLGACGITSTDSDDICAVSHLVFDAASTGSDPNQNPLCGLKLRLRRDGKSVDVTVVDRCVGCKATDIDVSPGVFAKLANIDQGRVLVQWAWLEDAPVTVPSS